jgi:hypothetical protein
VQPKQQCSCGCSDGVCVRKRQRQLLDREPAWREIARPVDQLPTAGHRDGCIGLKGEGVPPLRVVFVEGSVSGHELRFVNWTPPSGVGIAAGAHHNLDGCGLQALHYCSRRHCTNARRSGLGCRCGRFAQLTGPRRADRRQTLPNRPFGKRLSSSSGRHRDVRTAHIGPRCRRTTALPSETSANVTRRSSPTPRCNSPARPQQERRR